MKMKSIPSRQMDGQTWVLADDYLELANHISEIEKKLKILEDESYQRLLKTKQLYEND